jgi:hypothetical protein
MKMESIDTDSNVVMESPYLEVYWFRKRNCRKNFHKW